MNGLQLVAQLRAQLDFTLPAIVITGDTEEAALRSADNLTTRVLFKPVRPAVLKQALILFSSTPHDAQPRA